MSTHVTVWNEYLHELESEHIASIYPKGIHGCIQDFLISAGIDATTATLSMPDHGLTEDILAATDVLIWWGHMGHHLVEDHIVERVYRRVLDGMGLIVLHSGHASKLFCKLMGTDASQLKWRDVGEKEILWITQPSHPICRGFNDKIIITKEEMYGEHFNIPAPDEQVFISWFEGGEVFRSGCCWNRGRGKVFYFRPGHETYPIYHQKEIQQVILNAVQWAKSDTLATVTYGNCQPIINFS